MVVDLTIPRFKCVPLKDIWAWNYFIHRGDVYQKTDSEISLAITNSCNTVVCFNVEHEVTARIAENVIVEKLPPMKLVITS